MLPPIVRPNRRLSVHSRVFMSLLHAQDAELLLRSPEISLPPSAAFLGDALEWISMFIKA